MTIYASKSFKNLAKAVCPQGLALETQTTDACEAHSVVAACARCAGTQEQVVAADLSDGSCRRAPVHLDVAALVVIKRQDVVVVRCADTCLGLHVVHPALDDAESAAVVQVQQLRKSGVRGEHVRDGSCGAVGLRVKHEVQIAENIC